MAQLQNLPRKNAQQKRSMPRADILPSEKPALSSEEQKRLNSALLTAALNGNNADIKQLIKAGADIGTKNENDWTALHEAAIYGHTKTCALLIEEYAKTGRGIKEFIAATDNLYWTALHFAASKGHTQTCALLIEEYAKAGGDTTELIAATEKNDETALHWAAWNGHTETCALLIQKYAEAGGDLKKFIAAGDCHGEPAMQLAVRYWKEKTARFLRLVERLVDARGSGFIKSFPESFAAFIDAFGECLAA